MEYTTWFEGTICGEFVTVSLCVCERDYERLTLCVADIWRLNDARNATKHICI